MSIRSVRSKALRRFWEKGDSSKLPVADHMKVSDLLSILDAAKETTDLRIGKNFHQLVNTNPQRWSVNVTRNYRLTWAWDDGPVDVDLEDYH